jgi:hypothetical protein
MNSERGRHFGAEEFHNPLEPEMPNLAKQYDSLKVNTRISQIIQNPTLVVKLQEVDDLIATRNIQLYKMRHPEQYPDEPNTDTSIATYQSELAALKQRQKDLKLKKQNNPGIIGRIRNVFKS